MATTFPGIYIVDRKASTEGELKVGDGILWESRTTTRHIKVDKDDIKKLEWLPSPRGLILRVKYKSYHLCFAGLKENDIESVEQIFDNVPTERVPVSIAGKNWGTLQVVGDQVRFKGEENDQDNESLQVPLKQVSGSVLQGSNELSLEFHPDETAGKDDECLVEMRFWLPEEEAAGIHNLVLERGDIVGESGESIVGFDNLQIITPRGRYDADLYSEFLRLRGPSHDFKILYSTINMMFLLPRPDSVNMYFVISLDTPIRQGQTSYFHLVFQFDKENVVPEDNPIELSLSKEEEKKYKSKGVSSQMSGKLFEIVAKTCRALTGKKIIGPAKSYSSVDGNHGIKCSLTANEGYLFILEKSFFFIKPPLYIRHDEIKNVRFNRSGSSITSGKYFDISITLKRGKSFTFSNIMKREKDKLHSFLAKKDLNVEAPEPEATGLDATQIDDESDSEDEDFDPDAAMEEEEDDEDVRLEPAVMPDGSSKKSKKRKRKDEDSENASKKQRVE
eukprot:gb/GECH01014310.1/.p1 GENE.gb/GECH01014310.1/~~gb/GECH01014310.1/.p1  ORF type:complete len:504 (+),score=157.36 gb/GECH01014310.1/:1-1512(+)